MAQSVEHHIGKVEVPGSNPGNSSKRKTTVSVVFLWKCNETSAARYSKNKIIRKKSLKVKESTAQVRAVVRRAKPFLSSLSCRTPNTAHALSYRDYRKQQNRNCCTNYCFSSVFHSDINPFYRISIYNRKYRLRVLHGYPRLTYYCFYNRLLAKQLPLFPLYNLYCL